MSHTFCPLNSSSSCFYKLPITLPLPPELCATPVIWNLQTNTH